MKIKLSLQSVLLIVSWAIILGLGASTLMLMQECNRTYDENQKNLQELREREGENHQLIIKNQDLNETVVSTIDKMTHISDELDSLESRYAKLQDTVDKMK
jgi:predicted nuclease with TOPRIM domain